MITLYLARGTIAVASHIALEESGLDHQLEWLDFGAGAQRDTPYLKINPKGRVPSLITPDGVLTETPAILEHIAGLAPDAALMPEDTWARVRCREVMAWLAATVHVNHAHKMRGSRWTPDTEVQAALTAHVPVTMTQSATEIEARLEETTGPWLFEGFSVADAHLHAIARWLPGDQVDMDPFPRLRAHGAAMAAREGAARALAFHA